MAPTKSRRRKRFLRRHPMGLPTLFLVALVASLGMWVTFKAPDRTGHFAAGEDELFIPRGCAIQDVAGPIDPCDPPKLATPSTTVPAEARSVCRSGAGAWSLEVFGTAEGGLGVRWSVPSVRDPTHPVAAHWVAAWPTGGQAFIVNGPSFGYAPLPPGTGVDGPFQVWAGSIAAGGSLDGGIESLVAIPFDPQEGQVRLAAVLNDGELVLEVPPGEPHRVAAIDEELDFLQGPAGRLGCIAAP